MPNGKGIIIHLIIGMIKMSQYFPKPYTSFGGNINIKVDLSNYATKAELKNAMRIDTSKLAAKPDLVSLKAKVDKKDADVPIKLSKLSNVVNNIVKKPVYNKFVEKVNNIDTSGFV